MSYFPDHSDIGPLHSMHGYAWPFSLTVNSELVIFSANCPADIQLFTAEVMVTNSVALGSVQLRDAINGGGSPIYNSAPITLAGPQFLGPTSTSMAICLENSTLVLRRTGGTGTATGLLKLTFVNWP